jgi:hypothetical protein
LDDLLVLLQRNAFTTRRTSLLSTMLSCFGLAINHAKSNLTPATRFEHLGLNVDLAKRCFSVPSNKLFKVRG